MDLLLAGRFIKFDKPAHVNSHLSIWYVSYKQDLVQFY